MAAKTDILNYFGRNFRPLFEQYGIKFQDRKSQTLVRCPWHEDQHPSLSINTEEGTFYCHAGCGSGNIFDFYARMKGLSANGEFSQIVQGLAADFGIAGTSGRAQKSMNSQHPAPSPLLLKIQPMSDDLKAWLAASNKVYSDATLRHFGIGQSEHGGEPCLVIPINDRLQKLYFWKRLRKSDRWQHYPGGKGLLVGQIEDTEEVLLCEGEWDFLTLWDRGFRSLATGTTGAASFPKKYAELFKGKEAIIVYDRDKAGHDGARRSADILREFARSVKIAELPEEVGEHGDVSDYFHKLGRTAADFYEEVLQEANPYEPEKEDEAQLMVELESEKDVVRLHPAQDFVNGVMYYAVAKTERQKNSGQGSDIYLMTSERRVFALSRARALGLSVTHEDVQRPLISKSRIKQWLQGSVHVSVAEAHRQIQDYIREYIVLKEAAYGRFLSLWVMGTYTHRVFRYYPYVWLNSIVKSSGKTLLMEILKPIVFNGVLVVNPSPAIMYRYVSENAPTFMIDEVEKMRGEDKERYADIMAILNSGFNRNGTVIRCEGAGRGKFRWVAYSTYCPKMFAGLSDLDDVLRDRTIRMDMVKKAGEVVKPYQETDELEAFQQKIRDDLYMVGLMYAKEIANRYRYHSIEALDHLSNRERDIWQPIFVLADLVDREQASGAVTAEMVSLSRQLATLKQQEDMAVTEPVQLLVTWKEMMETGRVLPEFFEDSGNTLLYKSGAVFEFFKGTESFAWMTQQKTLTRRLGRLQITVERRRAGTGLERFYKVRKPDFEDLYKRLVPG